MEVNDGHAETLTIYALHIRMDTLAPNHTYLQI